MSAMPPAHVRERSDDYRRRRRELIRAHHPDRGGDPAVFIEVLRRLAADAVTEQRATEVRFVKRRRRLRVPDPRRPFRRQRRKRVI